MPESVDSDRNPSAAGFVTRDNNQPLLTVRDLGCQFGQRLLWQHLEFDLKAGERLAVAADSGRGKTVLLRVLSGLASPASGTIRFQGQLLSHWPMPAYRTHVMLLSQQPFRDPGTVESNLTRPFQLKSQAKRCYDRAQALRWLAPLGRDKEFLQRSMDHLSGGEAQLVAILRSEVEALLNQWLNSGSQHAWIWTTHDEAQRQRMSDRVLRLDDFA